MGKAFDLMRSVSKKLQLSLVVLALVVSTAFSVSTPVNVEAQSPSGGASMSSCALENIGWIACPVIRAAARASDYAFTFISQSFMQVEVSLLQGDGGTSEAWGITRNIANTLFVVFLLYVIYGILTGRGASNASIKRMLPRFFVAAILVNFSFIIGQLAVDISNIAGSSIQSMMTSVAGNSNIIAAPDGTLGGPVGSDGYVANDGAIARVASAVLSSPNIAWVLLVPLVTVVMSVSVITSVMIVILIIRKVLIVALLLLSPIAFVLYLLPNTEHYFSRWIRMFMQLLLLFPVMALLLGAGQIVGSAVMSTTGDSYSVPGDSYQTATGGTVSATTSLVAIGATVLPLLGTWYVFRGAMKAMDTSVARMQGAGQHGSGDPSKDAERMKRASQSMQRSSLMNRGADRLKRVTDMQSESSSSVVGVAGNSVIRRRKAVKTPEQEQFDSQVQGRLGELKAGVDSGDISGTPQQIYIRALQAAESSSDSDPVGSRRGVPGGAATFDSVELKAAEAYLLESIGRNPESNTIDPNSFLKQQQQQAQNSQAQQQKAAAQERDFNSGMSTAQQDRQGKQEKEAIIHAKQNQDNVPQPNQAIQTPGATNAGGSADAGKSDNDKSARDSRPEKVESSTGSGSKDSSGEGSIPTMAGGVQGDGDQLGRPLDQKGKLKQLETSGGGGFASMDAVERVAIRDGRISASNPAAINERIPTRLQPITDLEKKAQAIAAKHVSASQEKSETADTFEEELRLRAEKASLDPLRKLGASPRSASKKEERK